MRKNLVLVLIICTSFVFFTLNSSSTSTADSPTAVWTGQGASSRGHILAPGVGQALHATSAFTLRWQLDDLAGVESQDLVLSTDGGTTFDLKIAAHLPPEQNQLIWGTAPHNATGRAKLMLAVRLQNGGVEEIVSDDFSILPDPAPGGKTASDFIATQDSANVEPAFASTGNCVTATTSVLNYNMDNVTDTCYPSYGGEPALAQDPRDPSHFHTVTGIQARINSTGVNWQYSGTSSSNFVDYNGLASVGDLTTEIGKDGTVYVVSLASTFQNASPPNRILIRRSTDGGISFQTAVSVPGILAAFQRYNPSLTDTYVDKPVVAVHPNNKQILVITFNRFNSSATVILDTWVAICNAAATGDLSLASNWSIDRPKRSSAPGDYVKVYGSTHPIIDPVGSTAYWLFVVQTNDVLADGTAGASIYKYQLNNGDPVTSMGAPVQTAFPSVGYPVWTTNTVAGCTSIEECLRVSDGCQRATANFTKVAIDCCDPNAHRMYIPTLANTYGLLGDGLSSDLFMTVWQYTGTPSTITSRILPNELHKYAACAASDGHGRVWVNCYAVASANYNPYHVIDYQTAQMGAIAIDRITGAAGAIAYMGARVPQNPTVPRPIFLGDYVYTQGAFYPDPNNPGNVNGLGSRVAMPTLINFYHTCGGSNVISFWIGISGWK